jgi:hypothetical protein
MRHAGAAVTLVRVAVLDLGLVFVVDARHGGQRWWGDGLDGAKMAAVAQSLACPGAIDNLTGDAIVLDGDQVEVLVGMRMLLSHGVWRGRAQGARG